MPTPPALLALEDRSRRFAREIAVGAALTLSLGLGVVGGQDEQPLRRTSVALASSTTAATVADPAVPHAAEQAPRTPTAAGKASARVAKPAPRKAARKVVRWLPRGTGMWLHEWHRSESGSAPAVVQRAQAVGLTHLYVQTGSSRKGWIGDEVLSELLPATRGTDLKVIAWDFPKLVHPVADARRMARAALYRAPGVPRVAAVAPDVETGSEGTHLSARGIDLYYSTLRRLVPADIAILPTVPWPSEHRRDMYPYDRTAKYADAIIPMAYWYNRSPATVTETSMTFFKRYGKPVMPVGQGYDGRIDAPYLPADPAPDRSVQAFLSVARAHGARSVSLWSWQTTGPKQWGVLAAAGRGLEFLPPKRPVKPAEKAAPAARRPSAPAWTTRAREAHR